MTIYVGFLPRCRWRILWREKAAGMLHENGENHSVVVISKKLPGQGYSITDPRWAGVIHA